jgi:hypothetical protein
MGKAAWASR